jgi:penicillin-binding protein 1A
VQRAKRWVVVGLALVLLGTLAGIGSVAGVFWFYGRDVEAIDEAALRDYRPDQLTRVLDRNGTLIGELFRERRTLVRFEDIPSHVENAFLAAEDADFYHHKGMDVIGMTRALVANVRAGEIKQGASTITQQVVKNFILSPERTLERKVNELIIARRLETVLSKQEILELYLNDIYLGHGRYGIEEASRFYFGKGVADIDLGQAAILASLPKAPGRDSPFKKPDRAKERQRYVLQQLVRHGFARPQDVAPYMDASLDILARDDAGRVAGGAQEFVDAVRRQLEDRYGEDALASLGATVHTTVDLALQRSARATVREGLVALDVRRRYGHGIKPARERNAARALKKGQVQQRSGSIYPVIIAEAGEASLPGPGFAGTIGDQKYFVRVPEGSRYDDPEMTHAEQFPVGGITMARVIHVPGTEVPNLPDGWGVAEIGSGPEAAVVVANRSGEVLAMVGGHRYRRGDFNRVLQAKRQPGSSFKPFVYGAALASRRFTPATIVEDSPEIYEKWKPGNFERDRYRGKIRLREALTHSVNTIAIKLADEVGVADVHAFARAAGIESSLTNNLSLALGTSEVSPFELLRGYLTLARGGSRIEPTMIRRVEAPGHEPWVPDRSTDPMLEPDVAFVLTSMMTSVVQSGTARRARALKRPAAGKTGTASENRDAWFAGFTPDHVAVAWVGFDTPKPIPKETGGRAALPIWLGAMKSASEGLPVRDFEPPPGVEIRRIDRATGLLAAPFVVVDGQEQPPSEESVLDEVFVAGTAPVEYAPTEEVVPVDDAVLDLYGDEASQTAEGLESSDPNDGDSEVERGPEPDLDSASAPVGSDSVRPDEAQATGGLPSVTDAP